MATIPTPRSYSQIVGDMLDTLLSKVGIPGAQVGSPHLCIIEAAAQSDLRSSQDIFNLLSSQSLDRATGIALDRIGADEDAPRIGQAPSSGFVTISDSSFTKIESRIFQGLAAPIVGSAVLYVADATDFPAAGTVYVGRGTTNYEGPLTYTSKTNNTNYWTLNLGVGSSTTKYHNLSETVIVGQGGNRLIAAGSIIQTAQGNANSAIQFSLLFDATIPDGETEIQSVSVVARTPGTIGNVIAKAINTFVSNPFTGAAVINPLPFSNGLPTEDDNSYRERIRAVRQSRARGTPLALKTFVTGITALDENRRVLSASVVSRENFPTTLYIDDGTGYEEKTVGIPLETLVDEALGGEQYFQLVNGRPVTKAYTETTLTAPFALVAAMRLSVLVGGTLSEHSFSADEFRSISSASAYEVVASINGNEDLTFSARTTHSGTQVALFAKADTNEDIEVITPSAGFTDANPVLGFPLGRVDSLRLYKNDRLLSKDGQLATLASNPQGLWQPTVSGATFVIQVDGVDVPTSPINTYVITDADFVNAGTGYTSVSASNSLASWAQVLEFRIPGITVEVSSGALIITSNKGRDSQASLVIGNCDLVSNGLFTVGTSTGKDLDYKLDRNLGQIRLEDSLLLHAGDKLTAGSLATRAFLETADLGTVSISSIATSVAGQNGAELWFVIDGNAQIVKSGIGPSTSLTVALQTAASWGDRVRITAGTAVYSNVLAGDWAIFTDPAFNIANRGAWRVAAVDPSFLYIDIERPTAWNTPETAVLQSGGVTFVRTAAEVQRVFITTAINYTASSLATLINSQLLGGSATTYRTNRVRIRTNSFLTNGDIALVAQTSEAIKLTLTTGSAISNETSHLAAVMAGNPETGTPNFDVQTIATITDNLNFTLTATGEARAQRPFVALKSLDDSTGRQSNHGHTTQIEVASGTAFTVRHSPVENWLLGDRLYSASKYSISAYDNLTVVLDGDTTSHRFVVPMFRRVTPTTPTFGLVNTFKDADNGGASLAQAFGTTMDWRDFMVAMHARTKSHRIAGVDTNQTILWRAKRVGSEGNQYRIGYSYPLTASSSVLATISNLTTVSADVSIRLPSGTARTGVAYTNAMKLGYQVTAGPDVDALYTYTFILNYTISTVSNNDTASTATLTLPSGVTDCGLQIGDQVYVAYLPAATSAGYASGIKTITSRTATTITYAEINGVGTNPRTVANAGTVSFDTAEAKTTGSTVVNGDIFNVSALTSLPSGFQASYKVSALAAGSFTGKLPFAANAVSGTMQWAAVNATTNLAWFPLNNATITSIAAAVNAQGDSSPVTAVAVGDGTVNNGIITGASFEPSPVGLGGGVPWYSFTSGVNFVRLTNTPANVAADYTFTFKLTTDSSLATNSDWLNEDIRLVPITSGGVVAYLNTSGPSGLFASAEIAAADGGARPQIATLTVGSSGTVQVQGGTANSLTAAIKGSATVVSSMCVVVTNYSDTFGMAQSNWVSLQNTVAVPKSRIDSTTALTSITTGGVFTLNTGTPAWAYATTTPGAITSRTWQVEKHGNFVALQYVSGSAVSFAGVQEGDMVYVTTGSGGTVNIRNQGWFRVVSVNDTEKIFWIENPNVLEETAVASLSFLTYDSIIPGDILKINSTIWGAGNVGSWTVASIDLPATGGANNTFVFTVDVSAGATTTQGAVAALGTNSNLIQVIESSPSKLTKRIQTISINPLDPSLGDVKFDRSAGSAKVSEAAGTIITVLDKLAFTTGIAQGIDGYQHSTGLIAEANKVGYGDESDPASYPGVIAAGANVNIQGPLVRRVTVSLALRVRTGISVTDIKDQVRSAVATVVNETGVGDPVALGAIVAAAQSINGVLAVTVLSPTYSSGNDLIPVQPFEKPLVINIDQDVLISLVGE